MNLFKNHTPYKGPIRLRLGTAKADIRYTQPRMRNKVYHLFGHIFLTSYIKKQFDEEGYPILIPGFEGDVQNLLRGQLVKKDGQYIFCDFNGVEIGSERMAWIFLKRNFRIEKEYPTKVSEVWDEEYKNLIGYYGNPERGCGEIFKIGDRLFDQKYEPIEEDYEEWQWAGWELNLEKWQGPIFKSIEDVIPYRMRGKKEIETLAEAKEAARNLSNYLS